MARLRRAIVVGASPNALGLKVGQFASARISPVCGSMITAVPPAARLLVDAGAQLALGDVLQVLIDRQLERVAGGRRGALRG